MACDTLPGGVRELSENGGGCSKEETRLHVLPFLHFLGTLLLVTALSSLHYPYSLGLLGISVSLGSATEPRSMTYLCVFHSPESSTSPTNPWLLRRFFHWVVSRQLISSMSSIQFIALFYRPARPPLMFLWRAVKGHSSNP